MNVPSVYRELQYLILFGLFETIALSNRFNYPMGTSEEQDWLELYRRNLYKGLVKHEWKVRWEK